MEHKKIEIYNKKQEEITRRKQEKEFEVKRNMSEKVSKQKEREKKLYETKIRYENETEKFKSVLSDKLDKINDRVEILLIIYLDY
jgi:hypothetical protein